MCGIIYIKKKNKFLSSAKLNELLIGAYDNQSHRGSDGFGFVARDVYNTVHYKRATTLSDIKKELEKINIVEILFHHRYPTSTVNLEETAHPFLISDSRLKYDYYFVHNGSISNADKIKEVIDKHYIQVMSEVRTTRTVKNIVDNQIELVDYETELTYNDSEVLGIELALYNEGIIREVTSVGNATVFLIAVDKNSCDFVSLSFGRNEGRPLVCSRNDNYIMLSSESKDNNIEQVEPNVYWKYDYTTDTMEQSKFPVLIKENYIRKVFNGF